MSLPPRIILHSPIVERDKLPSLIEQCLRDEVRLIAVFGEEAEARNGQHTLLLTSAHADESLEEVLEFAAAWDCERDGLLEVRL